MSSMTWRWTRNASTKHLTKRWIILLTTLTYRHRQTLRFPAFLAELKEFGHWLWLLVATRADESKGLPLWTQTDKGFKTERLPKRSKGEHRRDGLRCVYRKESSVVMGFRLRSIYPRVVVCLRVLSPSLILSFLSYTIHGKWDSIYCLRRSKSS